MKTSDSLAIDIESKIELTEELIDELRDTDPQRALHLRSRLYAIQVILNEIEDEFLSFAHRLN